MTTNAGGKVSSTRISLTGDLWEAVEVKPRHASFGALNPNTLAKTPPKKLIIVNNTQTPIDLKDVRCTNPGFRVEMAVIEPGKRFEMTVSLVPPLEPGSYRGQIVVSTGLSQKPRLVVSTNVYVTPEVDVSPKVLTVPAKRTADRTYVFSVINRSGKPIEINEIAVSNANIEASFETTRPGQEYRVTIKMSADYKVPPGGDSLAVKTTCPSMPVVTVPIRERTSLAVRERVTRRAGRVGAASGVNPRPASKVQAIKPGARKAPKARVRSTQKRKTQADAGANQTGSANARRSEPRP